MNMFGRAILSCFRSLNTNIVQISYKVVLNKTKFENSINISTDNRMKSKN